MKHVVQPITNEYIASLNPCKDRHENYLQHFKDKEITFVELLESDLVSYDDKIWLAKRYLDKDKLCKFAIKCAFSVYHIYKKYNENDVAVIDLLNLLRSIKDFSNLSKEVICLIKEKKRVADAFAACDAAAATEAYFAYSAFDYAAAEAAAACVDYYAHSSYTNYRIAYADAYAAEMKNQKALNIKLMIEVVNEHA